jgi:hypothetical protein
MTQRRFWLAAFWLAVFAGTAVSLLPAPQLPDPWFPFADKFHHAVAYAVLFVLGWQAGYRSRWGLALGLLALGVTIELAQGAFTATRSAEWLDGVADAAGIGFGHLIVSGVERQRVAGSARVEQEHRR